MTTETPKFFECLEKDEFFVIICKKSEQRKAIHQYIEWNYPKTNNFGLYLNGFDSQMKRVLKCHRCSSNVPILKENYHCGYSENNKDEYYFLTCRGCDKTWTWEPNYDSHDDVYTYNGNNCILIGNFMKLKYNSQRNRKFRNIDKKDVQDIVSDCEIQIVKRPDKILNKKALRKYVNSLLAK